MLGFLTAGAETISDSIVPEQQFDRYITPPSLKQFRIWAPPVVYTPEATIRIEAPARARWIAGGDHDTAQLVEGVLNLQTDTDDSIYSIPVALSPVFRIRDDKKQLRYFADTVAVDLSGFTGSPVTVTFSPGIPSGTKTSLKKAQPRKVHVISKPTVGDSIKGWEELRIWIDVAGAQRPIWSTVPNWTNLLRAVKRPSAPFDSLRGFVLRSYYNEQFRRMQPYTMYVPNSLNMSKPVPLMILLHGSGGDFRNVVSDYAAGQRFEQHPMLIANAGILRRHEFRGPALYDVVRIIEDVRSKYPVDSTRIYLQGISLGGRGTLEIAALLPDHFAAASAQGVYGIQSNTLDPVSMIDQDPVAIRLAVKSDIRAILPNLRSTPVELLYGWRDRATHPSLGLTIAVMLRRLNVEVVPRGFDSPHNITVPEYDWTTTREWMLQHTREIPDEIRHRVVNLRYGSSGWVNVHALNDYSGVGGVYAKYHDRDDSLELRLRNIRSISFNPPGPVRAVSIDGSTQNTPNGLVGSPLVLQRVDADSYKVAKHSAAQTGTVKAPGRSGPIWDIWSAPVVYAFETGSADGNDSITRTSAMKSAVQHGMSWGDSLFPVVAADGMSRNDSAGNIVLFTTFSGRKSPLITKRNCLYPISDGRGKAHKREVKRIVAASDVILSLMPSPFRNDRSLLVVYLRSGKVIDLNDFGWGDAAFQVDWLAADIREDSSSEEDSPLLIRAAGVYDHEWNLGAYTTERYQFPTLLPYNHDAVQWEP